MIVVLRPVYRTGERVHQEGLEASGPVEVYRPMPAWLGMTSLATGGALLAFAVATRSGRRPNRPTR